MTSDRLFASACDLGRAIDRGDIDPLDLTEEFLAAIDANESEIYARTTGERALAEAKAASARAKIGNRLSLLDGVPISWKDLYDTAGILTEAGSALLKGRIPSTDARVLQRCTGLGLVCLGKTHTSELAFSGLGVNPVTGTPPCVNFPECAPGGSSSGAAASIAFGLAAAGIGSDTGGSVRVPAAWNDLVGLKTTSGLLPLEGVVPLCTHFDTIGPLARNVEDAAAVLHALMGRAKLPFLGGARMDKLRLLVIEDAIDGTREEPLLGFERAVAAFKDAGAVVERQGIPSVEKAMPLSGCLYGVEAYGRWMDRIERQPDAMFKEVRERFRSGSNYAGTDYSKAWMHLRELREAYLESVAGFDAVIAPTSPILPPHRERLLQDSEYFTSENLMALRNTRIGNLMEVPALTIPTGVPSTGIMLLGTPFNEARLLQIGKAAETVIAGNRS